jgi:ATP-binding cassette subfamily B protein
MKNDISFIKSINCGKTTLSPYKLYKHFIFSNQRVMVLSLVILSLLTGLIPSIDSLFLQKITDSIEAYSDKELSTVDLPTLLFKWVIIYGLWWEGLNSLWRVYDYLYLKAMPKIKAYVTDEFYDYVQYHSHEFFQSNLAGDISNRISEAARSIEMVFAYINETIVRKLSVLIFALVTLYSVHSIVAFIFFCWLMFFISISLYCSKKINRYSTIFSEDKALVSGKIVDAISNSSVIRMFSSHKFERKYLKKYINNTVRSDQRLQWFMFKLRYALGLSCSIMIGFMIYYIIVLRGNLEISIGQCALIITLCLSVIDNIWDLTQEFGDLFEQIGAFNQSISLLEDHSIKDIVGATKLIIESPSIEFRNVTFRFRNNDNSFENKSIFIRPHEKVGLAGFSGSGKTTFTNMISRLYEIESGHIMIDGQDISEVSLDSLHRNISIIPQEPILFHRTIRENILYGDPTASEEEMIEAAKSAYIHDFIIGLPEKYDTICGERGNNFSGGQKQRISIARAFLKKAPILILDEATNSLDSYTENLIQESLQKLMLGKTVIVIAHRLSTLLHMNRILVFANGHIVEDGSHELLRKDGVIYKMLWDNY